eukprot:776365-Pleurochrysis_carterae.AAC.1
MLEKLRGVTCVVPAAVTLAWVYRNEIASLARITVLEAHSHSSYARSARCLGEPKRPITIPGTQITLPVYCVPAKAGL